MNDLKCCPFCGGEAEVGLTNQHDKLFVVGCNTPMCYGNINHFTMGFASKESALNTWNTRAPMDNIVEKLEYEKERHEKDRAYWSDKSWKDSCVYNEYDMADRKIDCYDDAINIVKQEINNKN